MTEKILRATHEGELKIGDTLIKCAVLEDGTRVLTRSTFVKAIGRTGKAKGGREYDDEFRIPVFLTAENLKPFIPKELTENSKPIPFRAQKGDAIGYRAELLPQTCYVYLDAAEKNALKMNQKHIAEVCRSLVRGFAHVGIIALVDEATKFQDKRTAKALAEILDKFLAKEVRKWVKTFPDDFYYELFRLKGWQLNSEFVTRRPGVVGHITNDLVYERLAPGVLDELRKRNPSDGHGHRKHKHPQWLTDDIGHPRLREHITGVIMLMRASANWAKFNRLVERALPKWDRTLPIPLDEDQEG
jgi:hypothetical protein